MTTIDLTAEETVKRLQERLQDIIRLQQRAHLVEMSKLLNVCEEQDVDGRVWSAVDRVGDTVNHLGGFLADAQKLLTALARYVDEIENGERQA